MRHKNTKKLAFKAIKVAKKFTNEKITSYSGLTTIQDYVEQIGIFKQLEQTFPTIISNATKIFNIQIFSSIIYASLCGINRLSKIAKFTCDPLVRKLLQLSEGLDDWNTRIRLSQLGQKGANKLQELGLKFANKCVRKCNLKRITIDCDSTEFSVYGHQEGAAKGYNPKNRGKLSYHPLICFLSEMKIVVNSWFRTGSSYTSNGIIEFMKQTLASLPSKIKIFFRADSGFYNGQLFDLLEEEGHEYLVKAKLTSTLKSELQDKNWQVIDTRTAIYEFDYKANGWKKERKMFAIRIVKEYVEKSFFGKISQIPVYEYFCYCSNLKRLDSTKIHALYGQRAESENWIENTKNQLYAGQTITNDFHVNDILWQLSVMAYNISVLMRYESDYKVWRQEPKSFCEWFILVPGKVVTNSRTTTVKMSIQYLYSKEWMRFADKVPKAA